MKVSYRRCETGRLQGGRSIVARQNVNFPRCKTRINPTEALKKQPQKRELSNSFKIILFLHRVALSPTQ